MTAPTSQPPLTFTARTPEDVLAVVPVALGFVPTESVAMLTFGAGYPFHARVDLPPGPSQLPGVVDCLLDPVLRHRVPQVLFVVYTGDARLARRAARCLSGEFSRAGVEVLDVLRADGERWWPAGDRGPGVPYDLAAHPFSARAVLDGRVLHGSRAELRAEVARQPDRVAGVVAALAGLSGDPPDPGWITGLVTAGSPPGDAEVAALLRALLDPHLRDAAWCGLSRRTAPAHVAFWTDVVRRAPDPLVPAPAALLALAAWQAGHGALAWCALDRCLEVDTGHPLGQLVARVLAEAVPPAAWEEVR
ncbi:DUF4192 domain-containing protein [Nocardioides hungaricus]